MRQERAGLEQKAKELQARTADARRAKSAADVAVASAADLIEQIDSRRDLTAQYVGELQVAYTRLQQQVTALSTDKSPPEPIAVPFRAVSGGARLARAGAHRRRLRTAVEPARWHGREKRHRDRRTTKMRRSGPFTAARSATPVRSLDSARWSSSTTAAMATPSMGISPLRPCSRATPWRPAQRWEGSAWPRPVRRPCILKCESTAVP